MIPRLLSRAAACVVTLLAASAAQADDAIVIGFGGGLTGSLAFYDGLTRDGAQRAVDEINAAGGIAGRYKIEFRVTDVRSDAVEAAAAGKEFVAAGAAVLIAPCDLETAVAFSKPAQQAGIPIVAPCASAPTLAAAVGDFMFQIYPADNLQAAALAKFAREQGYGRAYILQSPDTPYTAKLPAYFAAAFEKMGGTVVGRATYAAAQQDFNDVVDGIRNLEPKPDVIMTGASEPEFPIFLRQLRASDVATPVLGGDAIDSPTTLALGDLAEGVVYTSAASPAAGTIEKLEIEAAATAGGEARTAIAPYAATGYEAIKLIAAAITKAGGTNGAAIRDALDGVADFPGVSGSRITLAGAHRVALRDVMLIRVEQGKRVLVKALRPEAADVPAPQ